MKLGTEFPQEWKDKSKKEQISLADILYGYAVEDIMQRISKSSFHEYLWLAKEGVLGIDAYRKKVKSRLEFFYVEREKKTFHIETMAGDVFGKAVMELFLKELFEEKEKSDIAWQYKTQKIDKGVEIYLTGTYKDMQVPVAISINTIPVVSRKAKEKNRLLFTNEKKSYSYFSYSIENILAEDLFEIMRKLELISDMGCYDRVNEILKSHAISGRHIIDEFYLLREKEPKVVTQKRLRQLSSYKGYGYMKKKWQQYAKHQKEEYDDWESLLTRITRFLSPIWTALCEDEIFLDDWMPELERFLG